MSFLAFFGRFLGDFGDVTGAGGGAVSFVSVKTSIHDTEDMVCVCVGGEGAFLRRADPIDPARRR